MSTAPSELESPEVDEAIEPSPPWVTIVWNDPVNLMDYVTFVFQTYFGYSKEKAEKLMMQVHQKGSRWSRTATARRWNATSRRCTPTACGPPARSRDAVPQAQEDRDRQLRRARGRHPGECSATWSSSCTTGCRRAPPVQRPARRAARQRRPDLAAGGCRPAAAAAGRVQAGRPGVRGVPPVHRARPARRQGGDAKRVLSALEESGADEIPLEPDEQLAWLRAINDLRLAIGTRLDIKEEDDYAVWEKLPDDDPRRLTYDLYDWLGYLQSALLHNMR